MRRSKVAAGAFGTGVRSSFTRVPVTVCVTVPVGRKPPGSTNCGCGFCRAYHCTGERGLLKLAVTCVPLFHTAQRPSGFVTRLRKSPAAEPEVATAPRLSFQGSLRWTRPVRGRAPARATVAAARRRGGGAGVAGRVQRTEAAGAMEECDAGPAPAARVSSGAAVHLPQAGDPLGAEVGAGRRSQPHAGPQIAAQQQAAQQRHALLQEAVAPWGQRRLVGRVQLGGRASQVAGCQVAGLRFLAARAVGHGQQGGHRQHQPVDRVPAAGLVPLPTQGVPDGLQAPEALLNPVAAPVPCHLQGRAIQSNPPQVARSRDSSGPRAETTGSAQGCPPRGCPKATICAHKSRAQPLVTEHMHPVAGTAGASPASGRNGQSRPATPRGPPCWQTTLITNATRLSVTHDSTKRPPARGHPPAQKLRRATLSPTPRINAVPRQAAPAAP